MNTRDPGKIAPHGDNLRRAMRWMSDIRQHDPSSIEDASRRFDLSPIEEEFLLREHARLSSSRDKSMRPDQASDQDMFDTVEGAVVCRPSPGDEFPSAENVHILESWNTARDSAVSIARARLESGKETEPHLLRTTHERYLMHSGEGEVRIGTMAPRAVAPGDVVFVPAGVSQSIRNTGTTDLVFFCICTPRFDANDYQSLPVSPDG